MPVNQIKLLAPPASVKRQRKSRAPLCEGCQGCNVKRKSLCDCIRYERHIM